MANAFRSIASAMMRFGASRMSTVKRATCGRALSGAGWQSIKDLSVGGCCISAIYRFQRSEKSDFAFIFHMASSRLALSSDGRAASRAILRRRHTDQPTYSASPAATISSPIVSNPSWLVDNYKRRDPPCGCLIHDRGPRACAEHESAVRSNSRGCTRHREPDVRGSRAHITRHHGRPIDVVACGGR